MIQSYSIRECRDVFGGQADRWSSGSESRGCEFVIFRRDPTRPKNDRKPAATMAPAPIPTAAIDRAANPSAAVSAPQHEQQVHLKPRPCRASRGNAAKEQELAERAACPRGPTAPGCNLPAQDRHRDRLRAGGTGTDPHHQHRDNPAFCRARKAGGATVRTVRTVRAHAEIAIRPTASRLSPCGR